MKTTNHLKTVRFSQGRCWALCASLAWLFCVVPAHALLVTVDLGWGYPGGGSLDTYNLQEGSIVQVLMFNSANASDPGTGASDNFPGSLGVYGGPGISAEPYPGTEPANVPTDPNVYSPLVAPAGHTIAYTTQIGEAVDGWWHIYAQFEILGTYDRLYIRVFGATEFPCGDVISSYWGISTVQHGTNIIDTWYVDPIVNVSAPNANYFEVIPEPSTVALFLLGGTGLWTGVRRRKKVG